MNLNWNWSWGSLSGLVLASQIVTGILLAMHYVGHVDHAFASVQHLMVDVPSGVILRYAHANGASLFFTVVYLHVLRGLYYSSGNQPREIVWISGVVILLLMVITAFIGYVLPWGQFAPKCFIDSVLLAFLSPPGASNTRLVYINPNSRFTLQDQDILKKHQQKHPKLVSICIGLLLGDGHLEKRNDTKNTGRLAIKQSVIHPQFFQWLYEQFLLEGLVTKTEPKVSYTKAGNYETTLKLYAYKRFNTYSNEFFGSLHNLFYNAVAPGPTPFIGRRYVKIIDPALVDYIDPLAIAVWVCDDGLARNGSTAFCTDCYSDPCIEVLISIFKHKYDIRGWASPTPGALHRYNHADKYTRLRVSRPHMPKFVSLIKPFLHPSMLYKLGDFKDYPSSHS
jgi:hypothetical protein